METPLTPNDLAVSVVTVVTSDPVEVAMSIPTMGTEVGTADMHTMSTTTRLSSMSAPSEGSIELGPTIVPKHD